MSHHIQIAAKAATIAAESSLFRQMNPGTLGRCEYDLEGDESGEAQTGVLLNRYLDETKPATNDEHDIVSCVDELLRRRQLVIK